MFKAKKISQLKQLFFISEAFNEAFEASKGEADISQLNTYLLNNQPDAHRDENGKTFQYHPRIL